MAHALEIPSGKRVLSIRQMIAPAGRSLANHSSVNQHDVQFKLSTPFKLTLSHLGFELWPLSPSEPWGLRPPLRPCSLLGPAARRTWASCLPLPHLPVLCILVLLLPTYPNGPITYFLEKFLISPQWKKGHAFLFRALCFDLASWSSARRLGLYNEPLSVLQLTAPNSTTLLMQL